MHYIGFCFLLLPFCYHSLQFLTAQTAVHTTSTCQIVYNKLLRNSIAFILASNGTDRVHSDIWLLNWAIRIIILTYQCQHRQSCVSVYMTINDDDEGRINFSVALSPKTTRTRNNKPKQWSHVILSQCNETLLVMTVRPGKKWCTIDALWPYKGAEPVPLVHVVWPSSQRCHSDCHSLHHSLLHNSLPCRVT